MANENKRQNPDLLDPAKRSAAGIGAFSEASDDDSGVEVVDPKLLEKQRERQRAEAEAELERQRREAELVEVREALRAERLIEDESDRTKLRILIITRGRDAVVEKSAVRERIDRLAAIFAEVHVIALTGTDGDEEHLTRPADNLWIYSTRSRTRWGESRSATSIAKKELSFGGGFRPDIIVAFDPFESAQIAVTLSKTYERPMQIHVYEDFFDPLFIEADSKNKKRAKQAHKLLSRPHSVRTDSEYLKRELLEEYPHLEKSLEVLPTFYPVNQWKERALTTDAHAPYEQFNFVIVHPSRMERFSHTDRAINGVARLLIQNPSVGMVIVGSGTHEEMLRAHVEKLGLTEKVVFETDVHDVFPFFAAAHALLFTSEDQNDQRVLLQAALSRTPIVSITTEFAKMLFEDGKSILMCEVDSPPCLGQKMSHVLSNNMLRKRLAMQAHDAVYNRVSQDYGAYLDAYQASIERSIIFADSQE